MTNIVKVHNDVLMVSTLDIWEGLGVEHRAIITLVRQYEEQFQSIRTFAFQMLKSKGRPTPYCLLDEEQTTFLITLMRNSDAVVPFKLKLTREFYRMRRELTRLAAQSQNAAWLEQRKAGKETRVLTTDTIKEFVGYAQAQGSLNAGKYYASISTMENKALFFLEQKFTNLRDVLNIHQLSTVKSADQIVIKALRDGMDQKMYYRDIYKLAKVRVESFAELVGKTLIPTAQLQITEVK